MNPPSRGTTGKSSPSAAARTRSPGQAAATPPSRRRFRRPPGPTRRLDSSAAARAVADRREIARPAAADHEPRRGAAGLARPRAEREYRRANRPAHEQPDASNRRPIASGSVSGAASRCDSMRAPATVTVRSIAAINEPRRSPPGCASTQVRACRCVDGERRAAASRAGGDSGGRLPIWVRST